jgi:anti-sigma regulatory factor (Ser/Thr protein kinase)
MEVVDVTTPVVWSLPRVPAAVGVARHRLRAQLGSMPEDRVDTVLLAASEVMANAVLHGDGPLMVQVLAGPDVLRVEVTDCGAATPRLKAHQSDEAVGGRGLQIVDVLATRWGVVPACPGPGKTVWFEVAQAPAHAAMSG